MRKVKIKHQPEHGIQEVTGYKLLETPITLYNGKVIEKYVMVGTLGGYHEDSLEVVDDKPLPIL